MINKTDWHTRWVEIARVWDRRLSDAGLSIVSDLLTDLTPPLKPVMVQLLWFTQPGAALLGQREAITALLDLVDSDGDTVDPQDED